MLQQLGLTQDIIQNILLGIIAYRLLRNEIDIEKLGKER